MPAAPIRILIVAALCVLMLIGFVVREGMARASGAEVVMAMAGVDPRSILSGNYVAVSLSERLTPPGQHCPATNAADTWLALSSEGGLAHVTGSGATRQEALQHGSVAVRGSVNCAEPTPETSEVSAMNGSLNTDLGINRVYLSLADANRVTDLLRHADPDAEAPVDAILSIGDDGRARLKGLMVKGQRMELTWL